MTHKDIFDDAFPQNRQIGGSHYKKMKIQPYEFISKNDLLRPTTKQVDTKEEDALENEIKAFIDNIITGKKHACSTDAKEGIKALQLAELIDSQFIEKD